MATKRYRTMKTGGDNLGGPSLNWWVILGPGLDRNHFQYRHDAVEAARVANEAFEAGRAALRQESNRKGKR